MPANHEQITSKWSKGKIKFLTRKSFGEFGLHKWNRLLVSEGIINPHQPQKVANLIPSKKVHQRKQSTYLLQIIFIYF